MAEDGLHDEVVGVVDAAGHLGLEALEHVVEGAGAADLAQHPVQLILGHQTAWGRNAIVEKNISDGRTCKQLIKNRSYERKTKAIEEKHSNCTKIN